MEDLTRAHIDECRKHTGVITLRDADSGWLLGVVADVEGQLDPLRRIEVSGTYTNGKPVERMIVEVPASVCEMGNITLVAYIFKKYGVKPL